MDPPPDENDADDPGEGALDLSSLELRQPFRDIDEEVRLVGHESNVVCRDMLTLDWQPREEWTDVAPHTGRYLHSYHPAWTGIDRSPVNFGYVNEVEHFALRCLGEVESGPGLWDSVHSLRFGEAVYESAEAGAALEI